MRVALLAVLLLAGCDQRPKVWTAYIYPDREYLERSVTMGSFKTFEQCQQGAVDSLRTLGLAEVGDYECGYRCGVNQKYGLNVCKETRK